MIRRRPDRRLETVLFTDMVGSTERAIELGDRAWRALLRRHHRTVRAELRRHGGHEVDSAGDGFFATFPQPAQAVRCALAIHASVAALGLQMRSAVHTGEVEPIGRKVGGVAVHLAARVLSAAATDEVLVTSTVRELVAGSELTFEDRGPVRFKGFAEEWHVFVATGPRPEPAAAAAEREGPIRRPGRLVLGVGLAGTAIGLIGAVAVVSLLSRGGLEPGPDTAVRIDPGSNRLERAQAVGRGPLAIAVGEGSVWVASEIGTVTRVDLASDRSTSIGAVGIPTALAVADDTVWVVQGYEGRVTRLDASSGQARDTFAHAARRVAADGDGAWLVSDLAGSVGLIGERDQRPRVTTAIPPDDGPRSVAVLGDAVWIPAERAMTLWRVDPASGEPIGAPIGLPDPPTDVAAGAGAVWLTSMDHDVVMQIDPDRGQVARTIRVCDGPDGIATTDDAVWIACRGSRSVWRLDALGAVVAEIPLPAVPAAIATAGDDVWVALRDN